MIPGYTRILIIPRFRAFYGKSCTLLSPFPFRFSIQILSYNCPDFRHLRKRKNVQATECTFATDAPAETDSALPTGFNLRCNILKVASVPIILR